MEGLLLGLRVLHSLGRWLVLLAALGALSILVRAAGGHPPSPRGERLVRLYPLLLDIQVTLGILLWLGQRLAAVPLTSVQIFHPVWGLLAAFAAHGAAAFRSQGNPARSRGILAAYSLSLLLILIALATVGAFPFGRR